MENFKQYLFLVAGVLILIFAVYFIYESIQKRRNIAINKNQKINSGRNRFFIFYKIFRTVPVIKKTFARVIVNTESVYPADQMSINKEATKLMMKSVGFAAAIIIATAVLSKGDLWYLLMGILTACVIFRHSISSTFQKKEYALLEQLKDFLSCVRHHYMSKPIVEDAVGDTLDEIPYEISLHISRIHEILMSPIMEEKTEEYTSTSPNRFLLLLLTICTSTKEYGDGDGNFLDALSYLKEEINAEKLKQDNIKHKFSTLTGICLCVVFFLKPVEMWAIGNMPELSSFYSGMAGKAVMVVIFILCFACYYLIDVLKESKRGEIVKQNIWSKIASLPVISPILNKVVNKNYMQARRLNEDMKEVGDQTGPKAFIAKQCVFALAAFVFLNSTVFVTTVQKKLTMLGNYVAEFDDDIVPNEKYRTIMQQTAKDYSIRYRTANPEEIDKDALIAEIQNEGVVKNNNYASLVADEIVREIGEYKNTYFKWYMVLISVAAAAVAFYVPKWYLKFKCKVSSMNKEEEVNQFQTLILILMHADGVRLDTILEWMDRFAYSFKASIEDCIINLESGEQEALEQMQMQEDNKSFQRFVDCLLSIDDTDIETAFAELVIDREYSLKDREQKNEQEIEKKSMTAKTLAFIPFITLLVVYLIGPMVVLAVKMLMMTDFSM